MEGAILASLPAPEIPYTLNLNISTEQSSKWENNFELLSFNNEPNLNLSDEPAKLTRYNLRLMVLNCRSLRSQEKRNELAALLISNNIDIVLGCESHLDDSFYSSEILPKEYTIIRKDRCLGGGVCLLDTKSI